MKMVDMKLPKRSTAAEASPVPPNADAYPYGLCLRLNEDEIAKLPELADLSADTYVTITAKARVKATRSEDRVEDGKTVQNRSVELQIESIGISDEDELKEAFDEADDDEASTAETPAGR